MLPRKLTRLTLATCFYLFESDTEMLTKKTNFVEGTRYISQIQIPDFNAKQNSPEAYQCAFTSDLKRLLIVSIDGIYHRYR